MITGPPGGGAKRVVAMAIAGRGGPASRERQVRANAEVRAVEAAL
jgi:hypothetical protein